MSPRWDSEINCLAKLDTFEEQKVLGSKLIPLICRYALKPGD